MDEDTPKIKKFHITNNSLKELGEVIANENGRRIIMALVEKEMYINEISKTLDIPVGLVLHHIQKLEKLDLLIITDKPISKKTKDHRFFKIKFDVFLEFTKEDDSKLKRIFKEGIKFASIGIVGLVSLISINSFNGGIDSSLSYTLDTNTLIIITLTFIIIGLIYKIIFKK